MNPSMPKEENIEVNFLNSYRADTSIVPDIISRLITDLQSMQFPKDEIDEIVLSMDEAITNAVQETIRKEEDIPLFLDPALREITVRYKIRTQGFDATIIDHGKGLDIKKMNTLIPCSSSLDYHDQVLHYANESEKHRLKVRLNGKEITLKGIGAGLRIMVAFMDSVSIDLIDTERVISDSVSACTDGTILNLARNRRM